MHILMYAADLSYLGRANKSNLSTQTLMELLVGQIHDESLSRIKSEDGQFVDIHLWDALSFNANDELETIKLDFFDYEDGHDEDLLAEDVFGADVPEDVYRRVIGIGGILDFQWIPETVTAFYVSMMEFGGTVNTSDLPSSLVRFSIANNNFSGSFALRSLPESILYVTISFNNFSGNLTLQELPRKLKLFDASSNQFSGMIDLNQLPPTLFSLILSNNQLSGDLSLMNPSSSLENIDLFGNRFSDVSFRVTLSESLKCITVDPSYDGRIIDANGKAVVDKRIVTNVI